jgi:hypothetical protein
MPEPTISWLPRIRYPEELEELVAIILTTERAASLIPFEFLLLDISL